MSVAFDSDAVGNTASGTSVTFNLVIGGGVTNGAVLVMIGFNTTEGTSVSVTVGGSSATEVSGAYSSVGFVFSRMFAIATGSSTGTKSVVASWTGTTAASVIAMSASGVDQTTPANNGKEQVGMWFGDAPSFAITSASSDLSVDCVLAYTGGASGNTQTILTAAAELFASRATTPASSVTHSWTANAWQSHSGCNLVAAAASGGSLVPLPPSFNHLLVR